MMKTSRLESLYAVEKERLASVTDGKGDYLHPVFGEGDSSAPVMLIGEAPGRDEAEAGRPFVGKAGESLRRMLSERVAEPKSIFITNSVKYRPVKVKKIGSRLSYSNRTPTAVEIKEGAKLLSQEIELISPKVIVTLGNTPKKAVELVTGEKIGTLSEVHGKPYFSDFLGLYVIPLFHPASGIYNRELVPVMDEDMKKLGKFLKEGGIL